MRGTTSRARVRSRLAAALAIIVPTGFAAAETTRSLGPQTNPWMMDERPAARARNILHLSAILSATDRQPLRTGLHWRVYDERADSDGVHRLVAQSSEASPAIPLEDGVYIIHASFGLSGTTRRVVVNGRGVIEKLVLNAGALRIVGMLGDAEMPPARSSISVFVPEPGNSEAKLVVANARSGVTIGLPEGNYHVVSTLLDGPSGSTTPTNSVVNAELRVQAGKLTDATLRHRAAVMTLKLVSKPGGEALANTSFTILTPGGDVIREMIGAFPSLLLAEGEYIAIARHDNKAYQANFKVEPALDQDVEVLTD